ARLLLAFTPSPKEQGDDAGDEEHDEKDEPDGHCVVLSLPTYVYYVGVPSAGVQTAGFASSSPGKRGDSLTGRRFLDPTTWVWGNTTKVLASEARCYLGSSRSLTWPRGCERFTTIHDEATSGRRRMATPERMGVGWLLWVFGWALLLG